MERSFAGEKSIPESRWWIFIVLLLIACYGGMFGHFHLKKIKSPYAKYSVALFLPLLPLQYWFIAQIRKSKRSIAVKDEGISVSSARKDSTVIPYDDIESVKVVRATPTGERLILKAGTYGLLSILLLHGGAEDLAGFIVSKAPSAAFDKVDNSAGMERKAVLLVLTFVLAVIAGTFVVVFLATR